MVDLQESRPRGDLGPTRSDGHFLRDAGRLDDKGAYSLRLYSPRSRRLLVFGPKDRRALIWSGWWTWLVPLALFATWLAIGCATNPEFYNDVVVREFMSRFDQSLKAHETAANLVLLSARGAQVRALEPLCHRVADCLHKCAQENNLRSRHDLARSAGRSAACSA